MKINRKPNNGFKYDTEYHISVKDRVLYLEFQGSEYFKHSPLDWILNFLPLFIPVKLGGLLSFVQLGLYIKYRLVKNDVIEKLHNYMYKADRIEFCNYSQGSAIALLFYIDYLWFFQLPVKSVLCGCPNIIIPLFNRKMFLKRCRPIVNIQNGNDWVTKLAPGIKPLGTIRRKGIRTFGISLKDHHIENYIEILKGLS